MIFSFFYDAALFLLAFLSLPSLFWKWFRYGKYRESLQARLGFHLPKVPLKKKEMRIWIHAVSLGETRALIPFFDLLRTKFPEALVFVSSTTETGHAEAKRSLSSAAAHFFIPFDFSWIVKRVLKHIQPDILILVESDFWYHLLTHAKKRGAKVFLVNGKISERSAHRFQKVPFFAKKLFASFDTLCVQNAIYYERFIRIGIPQDKLVITGNLKFDSRSNPFTLEQKEKLKNELGLKPEDRIIAIGSTHFPEEKWILAALDEVWKKIPQLKVLLVPRHPHRFDAVMNELSEQGMKALRYSKREDRRGDEKVILIDAMGLLSLCYELSELAIVGGSFVKGVGGHNIFEPVQCGIPVLFGPHMEQQVELIESVLESGAGKQLPLEELSSAIFSILNNEHYRSDFIKNAHLLTQQMAGAALRSLKAL